MGFLTTTCPQDVMFCGHFSISIEKRARSGLMMVAATGRRMGRANGSRERAPDDRLRETHRFSHCK
jgi:hypothetical protein